MQPTLCDSNPNPPQERGEGDSNPPLLESKGGGALRRLQKPYQTALGILARLNVPGGTVADWDLAARLSGAFRMRC